MRALRALLIAATAWLAVRGETHLLFGDATGRTDTIEATCVNDDYKDAIAWITPLEREYTGAIKVKNSMREVRFDWSSGGFDKELAYRGTFGPVRDYTWELLPIFFTETSTFEAVGSIQILGQFELNFSFLGKADAHIYICSQNRTDKCIVFVLGGKEGIIRRCDSLVLPITTMSDPKCTELPSKGKRRISFSDNSWSQVSIRLANQKLNIEIDDSNILKYNAETSEEFNLYENIYVSSSENAFWKYHAYEYYEQRQWTNNFVDSEWFSTHSTNLCISFFVNFQRNIKLQLYHGTIRNVIEEVSYTSDNNSAWNFKTFNATLPSGEKCILRINYENETQDLVAFRNIMIHDNCDEIATKNQFHSSTLTHDKRTSVTCSSLGGRNPLKLRAVVANDNYCKSEDSCRSCEDFYQQQPRKCPHKMTCNQNACYCSKGFTGRYCEDECKRGMYGYNCAKTCGNCLKGESCGILNGKCANGCDDNYIEPKCIKKYPVFIGTVEIEDNCVGTCRVILYNDTLQHNGTQTPMFYYVTLFNLSDNNRGMISSNTKLEPINKKEIVLTGLDKSSKYALEVNLCTNDTKQSCFSKNLKKFAFSTKCKGLTEDLIRIQSTDRTATITLDDRNPYQCDLNSYDIYVIEKSGKRTFLEKQAPKILVSHLEIFTNYSLNVRGNGQDITKVFCTDESVPGIVQNIKISTSSLQTLVTWTEPYPVLGTITNYKLQWTWLSKIGCPVKRNKREFNWKNVTSTNFVLTNLKPYSNYEVSVFAYTKKGGGKVNSITMTTQPIDINEVDPYEYNFFVNATDVKLNWTVDCDHWNGPVVLEMKATCISEWCRGRVISNKEVSNNITEMVLSTLQPYTDYSFEINLFGGAQKNAVHLQTLESTNIKTLPSSPRQVPFADVYAISDTNLSIRWNAPYPPTGQLESFRIQCSNRAIKSTYSMTRCRIWPDMYCVTLTDLKPANSHEISISARNKDVPFYGQPMTLVESTNIRAPERPLDIQGHFDDWRFLILQWQHPNRTNAPYIEFEINVRGRISHHMAAENLTYSYNTSIQCTPNNHHVKGNLRSAYRDYKSKIASFDFTCPVFQPSLSEDPTFTNVANESFAIHIPPIINAETNNSLYVILITDRSSDLPKCIAQLRNIIKVKDADFCYIIKQDHSLKKKSARDNNEGFKYPPLRVPLRDKFKSGSFRVGLLVVNEFEGEERFSWYIMNESAIDNGSFNCWWLALVAVAVILIATMAFLWYRKPVWFTRLFSTADAGTCKESKPETIPLQSQHPSRTHEPPSLPLTPIAPPNTKVALSDLYEYVRHASLNGKLEEQHAMRERGLLKPHDCGIQRDNYSKNRYKNLIAYDHTRVKLQQPCATSNCKLSSDYINANYIKSGTCDKAFIATQGPLDSTIYDFWCMVLSEGVQHIIILANLVENGKKKVSCYWPDFKKMNRVMHVRDIKIEALAEKTNYNFVRRTFAVTQGDVSTEVTQHHFTNWPDHGVPMYPQSLIPFAEVIRAIPHSSSHPILVHCSAGVGRTGTIILLDICLRQALETNHVDIFREYSELREQRANLVDNVEQYILVHLVLLEYFADVKTAHSTEDFEEFYAKLSDKIIGSFLVYISKSAWQESAIVKTSGPALEINAVKNRDSDIVPSQYGYLYLRPTIDDDSIYINAVAVDGFDVYKQFIATQHPLSNTVDDFWRLVIGEEINVIVSLQVDYDTEFWKNGGDFLSSGNTSVEHIEYEETEANFVHDLLVSVPGYLGRKKNKITLIELKDWKVGDAHPTNLYSLILLWKAVKEAKVKDPRVLIMCRNGASACGLFIALTNVLDRMESEQVIDICLAVRIIRRSRRQFVRTLEQLKALYRIVTLHLSDFEQYSNFTPVRSSRHKEDQPKQ